MKSGKHAVIDIGTNSVKLLVANLVNGEVFPIKEKSEQTRLGQGFYETHRLQPSAIELTANAVLEFKEKALRLEAESIRVLATSAVREAINREELISAVKNISDLDVEVISGSEEAHLVFQGVLTDPALQDKKVLILDVGGGSTEFVLGEKKEKYFQESFLLGTVRLMEACHCAEPPTPEMRERCRRTTREFIEREISPKLLHLIHGPRVPLLVGTGGTATILARIDKKLESFERDQIEGSVLTHEAVQRHLNHLWSLPLSERRQIPGLPPKRADVILTGVSIYEAVMEKLHLPSLYVSTRGLRFAALLN